MYNPSNWTCMFWIRFQQHRQNIPSTLSYLWGFVILCLLLQFYRCFQSLVRCETPRRGSSFKTSSKLCTKKHTGQRQTNDFLFMVASLGQPAATVPQLDPSCEPTIDITKGPSSDKPVVVSLVAHLDVWWLASAMKSQSPQPECH